MSKQADILARWHELDAAGRLDLLENLMNDETLDDETVAAIQALFFEEMTTMAQDEMDALLNELLTRAEPPKKRRSRKTAAKADAAVDEAAAKDSKNGDAEQAVKPKRRRKTAQQAQPEKLDEAYDVDDEKPKRKRRSRKKKPSEGFAQETMLELAEVREGMLILREMGADDEPLVRIEFSEKVRNMLGDDVRVIGQAMIHAAIASVVQHQAGNYHAHVFDEEPVHYS